MAEEIKIPVMYGLNLSAEELLEWSKREPMTYLECEIPSALEKKLSKMVNREIKKYLNSKKKKK